MACYCPQVHSKTYLVVHFGEGFPEQLMMGKMTREGTTSHVLFQSGVGRLHVNSMLKEHTVSHVLYSLLEIKFLLSFARPHWGTGDLWPGCARLLFSTSAHSLLCSLVSKSPIAFCSPCCTRSPSLHISDNLKKTPVIHARKSHITAILTAWRCCLNL